MRKTTSARYMLPAPPWKPRGKPYPSTYEMGPEEAERLGALGVVPGTLREIEVPETEEERRRAQVQHQSAGRDSVQPPRK